MTPARSHITSGTTSAPPSHGRDRPAPVAALRPQELEARSKRPFCIFDHATSAQSPFQPSSSTTITRIEEEPLYGKLTQANSTEAKLAGISQELAKTAGARSIILRAPEAGTVSTIVVDPGQAVQAGQSVISVMPAGSVLRAQLLVPSRAIGFIHPGSRLNLRYAAFPYQEFGQYHGVVTSISRSALTPAQVSGLIQEQTKHPLYRVMVRLDRQLVDVYGRPEHLKAGLGLKASIMLDRRRLIQWVFEPLYGLGRNIFGADRVHNVTPAMAVPRAGSAMPMTGSHA